MKLDPYKCFKYKQARLNPVSLALQSRRGMCSLVCRKKASVLGFDFLGLRFCTVGDPGSRHFLSNSFNLQVKKKINEKKESKCILKCRASLSGDLHGSRCCGGWSEGGPGLYGHQIWRPASASSCKYFHSPVPVQEMYIRCLCRQTQSRVCEFFWPCRRMGVTPSPGYQKGGKLHHMMHIHTVHYMKSMICTHIWMRSCRDSSVGVETLHFLVCIKMSSTLIALSRCTDRECFIEDIVPWTCPTLCRLPMRVHPGKPHRDPRQWSPAQTLKIKPTSHICMSDDDHFTQAGVPVSTKLEYTDAPLSGLSSEMLGWDRSDTICSLRTLGS